MKEFLKALRPLKIKIILELCINWLISGLAIGLILAAFIILVSKFIFIDKLIIKVSLTLLIGIAFAIIMIIVKKPNTYKIAFMGDSLGFKQRFITAYEILNSNNIEPITKLVVTDAIEKAKNADFKNLYKINISAKRYISLGLALIIIFVSGFIPVVKTEQIESQAKIHQKIDSEIKKIDLLSTEVNEVELKKQLKVLKNELKKSNSEANAIKSIQKTQQELKKIESKSISKDLKELGKKLSENELTKGLGDQLQNGSVKSLQKQIESAKKLLENMSESELKELADRINKLADELTENNELKQTLEQLTNALNSANSADINNSLNQFGDKLSQLSQQNDALKQATEKLNTALNQSTQNLQGQKSNQNNNQNSNQSSNQNNNQNSNQNSNQNNNNSNQSNNQNSNQNKSGNLNGNGNGSSNGNSGSGRGTGSIPNENIYTRELQQMMGTDLQIQGQKNEGGTFKEVEKKGDGETGEIVNYDRVYQQYKQEALSSLNNENIPVGMKNLVEEYFSSLE